VPFKAYACAALPSNLKGRGWSDAKAFSSTQLQKNPNAYFYRHVAPGETQVWVVMIHGINVLLRKMRLHDDNHQ
jgi:hypothetical protein